MTLGNSNGIVVMTDSMQPMGGRQLPEPGKKLLKYDDQLVCAIAGLGGVNVPAMHRLSKK
jgi:20S proteasome alpha/beta subunit